MLYRRVNKICISLYGLQHKWCQRDCEPNIVRLWNFSDFWLIEFLHKSSQLCTCMSLKEQDKAKVRTTPQTRAEQLLPTDKTVEMDEECLMAMFCASIKVSMETIQAELEREWGTSQWQMQQQLESLTSQFTHFVPAAQTNQSVIQNAPVKAENTTIQIVKFTDCMDTDVYLTTFDRTDTQNS